MDCLVWTGARSSAGYGQRWRDGKVRYVHRETWEEANGPIPPGMLVMHTCDNPPCFRLAHLRLGTQRDNIRDAASKGHMTRSLTRAESDRMNAIRIAKGITGGRPRSLSPDQTAEVRRLRQAGLTQAAIARLFGVSQPTIHNCLRHQRFCAGNVV